MMIIPNIWLNLQKEWGNSFFTENIFKRSVMLSCDLKT